MLDKKKLLSDTVLYSVGEIVPKILGFVLLPILTVYLSTQEYGINSYTTSVMMFVYVITSLSLNTYLLSQFYKEDDLEKQKNLVGSIFCFMTVFNVFVTFLQFFIIPGLLHFFNIDIPFNPFFKLAILNNFFDVMAIVPLALYRVNQDVKGFLFISLSKTILQYLLVIVFVVYLDWGLEGNYYGRLLGNIPFIYMYFRYIHKKGNFRVDFSIVKKALKFSLPLLPGSISYLLISLSDRILLERYISLNDLGIYSVAFVLATALNIVIQALYKTLEPILFKEHAGDNFNSINALFYKSYICLIMIAAFAVSIFSKEIFILAASKDFCSGYKVVPVLVASVAIAGINIYLQMLLIINKKQKLGSLIIVISGIISVIANLLLIPLYGYYGAGIAAVISFLTVNVICHFNIKIEKRFILSQVFLIVTIVAVPYLFDAGFEFSYQILSIAFKLLLLLLFIVICTTSLNINIGQITKGLLKSKNS